MLIQIWRGAWVDSKEIPTIWCELDYLVVAARGVTGKFHKIQTRGAKLADKRADLLCERIARFQIAEMEYERLCANKESSEKDLNDARELIAVLRYAGETEKIYSSRLHKNEER